MGGGCFKAATVIAELGLPGSHMQAIGHGLLSLTHTLDWGLNLSSYMLS